MTAPKTPQDHKKPATDKVTFKTSKGKLVLPHFSQINGGALRKARKAGDDMDAFFIIIEEFCGDPSPELAHLDSLPVQELGELFLEWTQGASVGESSSSEN
jgi:hypothetical protein